MQLKDLWSWRGVLSRGDFVRWGALLFIVKYNLDRLVAYAGFDVVWYPWSYLLGQGPQSGVAAGPPREFFLVLLGLGLPFVIWGVTLTLRRLRDIGWPSYLVTLFFLPFINLLFFALLCVQPSRQNSIPPLLRNGWLHRVLANTHPLFSAFLAVLFSVLLGLALTIFGTAVLQNYGWGLFVGIPFMMGFFGALFQSSRQIRTWGECASVALVAVAIASGLLVALAVEGVICVLMAAPIGIVLALLGASVGWVVQLDYWSRRLDQIRLYAAAWVLAPLLLIAEDRLPVAPPLIAATTQCIVAAPPEKVWPHVISFSELSPPTDGVFLLGIAYPVRAKLIGRGVGAVRYCEFSTGPFVEPITAWDENRRLAFTVTSQPPPMREWSPYANLQPAHLDGFFRSRRGEFRLTPLPNGQTLLEGTTWYEQAIWPQFYWQPWSDFLIHSIHRRVLEHIKSETERA